MIKAIGRFFKFLGQVWTVATRCVWLAVVAFGCIAVYELYSVPTVDKPTVLNVSLIGELKETGGDSQNIASMVAKTFSSTETVSTSSRDVVLALRAAASDPMIAAVEMNLSRMTGISPVQIGEITRAMDEFRKTAKKQIWVWGTGYSQQQYRIASHADRIALAPLGHIRVNGLSSTGVYLSDLFKEIGIRAQGLKEGKYKSAVEMFTRNSPSPEHIEALKAWMDTVWAAMGSDIEAARHLEAGTFGKLARDASGKIDFLKTGQDSAEFYRTIGLVDAVESREEFEDSLIKAFPKAAKDHSYRTTTHDYYLLAHRPPMKLDKDGVVVIALEGTIGSELKASDVRLMVQDLEGNKHLKGIVLRINSPGGDAIATEEITAAVRHLAKDIPVVVSMGDAAASGGYWLSTVGQKVLASPETLTGSIGVFSVSFDAEELARRLKVGVGGYKTSPLSRASVLEKRSQEALAHDRAVIDNLYVQFKKRVARARAMTPEEVEKVAQGRIWSGEAALKAGLVDELGTLDDAIKMAKSMGKLPESAPVVYYGVSRTNFKKVLLDLVMQSESFNSLVKMLLGADLLAPAADVTGELMLLAPETTLIK